MSNVIEKGWNSNEAAIPYGVPIEVELHYGGVIEPVSMWYEDRTQIPSEANVVRWRRVANPPKCSPSKGKDFREWFAPDVPSDARRDVVIETLHGKEVKIPTGGLWDMKIVRWRYADEFDLPPPEMPKDDTEQVGDVTSTAKGSGARYNSGKPDLSQIPLGLLCYTYKPTPTWLSECLRFVNSFQFREWADGEELLCALNNIPDAFREAAYVFSYGEKKYAKYNWMKGMAWSIPLACIGRHALAIIEGEEIDAESGRPHAGHIACNIIMLLQYVKTFPEGDDRPCLPN